MQQAVSQPNIAAADRHFYAANARTRARTYGYTPVYPIPEGGSMPNAGERRKKNSAS